MKYTVKFWETKEKYDLGEAEVAGDDFFGRTADIMAMSLLSNGAYAVEIFETVSGNTIFHSLD